jgi:KDO2-lipid IV(A) lauroyltransferase
LSKLRHKLEYFPVRLLATAIGVLPRALARSFCQGIGMLMYTVHRRLRSVGLRNLDLAFPGKSRKEKLNILRGLFKGLGRQLAEFALFPRYTKENVSQIAIYDGFQNFAEARSRGKGVLFLTAHFGGWEIDAFVDGYRTLHGNRTFGKQDFARGLLTSMKRGEVVGILMDTNMTPPQGSFVDFFGVPACTATGVARVALHTGAAVLPAFTIWDKELGKYKIRFDPPLQLVRSGDDEADAIANTALFTKVIESYATRYPEQWLWVHRRWKTRPPGEPSLY